MTVRTNVIVEQILAFDSSPGLKWKICLQIYYVTLLCVIKYSYSDS